MIHILFLVFITSPLLANWREPTQWQNLRSHSTKFLDQHGWNGQSCAAVMANDGQVTDQTRYLIAAGRKVYGYVYSGNKKHLPKAMLQSQFMLDKMVDFSDPLPYFYEQVNPGETQTARPKELIVNKQAYGLMGLIALYHANHDDDLLNAIEQLYKAFYERFHDPVHGGFYEKFDMQTGKALPQKSFASSVYILTALLLPLAETNIEMTKKMESIEKPIRELGQIIAQNFFDPKTGWIYEEFNEHWQPEWRDRRDGNHTISIVGHNFQMAWVLLRLVQRGYVRENAQRYKDLAKTIITSVIANGGADETNGGFYNGFKRETNELQWGSDKAWWQQAEGILAITLAEIMGVVTDQKILKVRDRAIDFYFSKFIDRNMGGVYAQVARDGTPRTGELKASEGKADYHDNELAHFMLFYARPISDAVANSSYPGEAISGGSMEDTTPEARRARALRGKQYGPYR